LGLGSYLLILVGALHETVAFFALNTITRRFFDLFKSLVQRIQKVDMCDLIPCDKLGWNAKCDKTTKPCI